MVPAKYDAAVSWGVLAIVLIYGSAIRKASIRDDGLNAIGFLILEVLSPVVVGVACLLYVAFRSDYSRIETITPREQRVIARLWVFVGILLLHAGWTIWRMNVSNTP